MRTPMLLLAVPFVIAYGQDPAPPASTTAAAPVEKTVEQTASPELVGELVKELTIAKLAPTLVKAVQSKGGAEVGALLAGALK